MSALKFGQFKGGAGIMPAAPIRIGPHRTIHVGAPNLFGSSRNIGSQRKKSPLAPNIVLPALDRFLPVKQAFQFSLGHAQRKLHYLLLSEYPYYINIKTSDTSHVETMDIAQV
jgi:hypothetical protein